MSVGPIQTFAYLETEAGVSGLFGSALNGHADGCGNTSEYRLD